LRPEGLHLQAAPEVPRPQAARLVPLMERRLALPMGRAARRDVLAGPRRGYPAHPSAAVAQRGSAQALALPPAAMAVPRTAAPVAVRHLEPAQQGAAAGPRPEVQRAPAARPQAARVEVGASGARALPREGREAVWDARAEPRRGAGSGAAVRLPEEAAVQGVAEAVQQLAAERDVVVLPQAAERDVEGVVLPQAVAAVRLPGAARGAEVPLQGARDAPAVQPSAAAWAVPPCLRVPARPAPSPRARSAHARKRQRIAQP
jgi:hypothetical protein